MAYINWSNVSEFGDLPAAANTASDGSFWIGMFYMIYIIMIMLMIPYGFLVAVITSTFVMIIIGLMLSFADLIAFQNVIALISIELFFILLTYYVTSKNRR